MSNTRSYDDFLSLSVVALRSFLSVRGIPSSGYSKVELVARAFSASEMNLPIIMSNEEQTSTLKKDYESKLKELGLPDPFSIGKEKRIDNIMLWPKVNLGNIFQCILSTRDFDSDYIGKYKDQKAYSYFDSGFVGEILIYEPSTNVKFLYCDVRASMAVHKSKELWVATKDDTIITSWCSCMAGSSACCNHVIATLYKVEYATNHGYNDLACTSMPCKWNQSTKKEIVPRRITEIVVRKKSRTKVKENEIVREERRLEALQKFDPRRPAHCKKTDEDVSSLLQDLWRTNQSAVLFKSIEGTENASNATHDMLKIASKVISRCDDKTDEEKQREFYKELNITENEKRRIEISTRGQADSKAWVNARKGRITASVHHEVFTKMNSIARKRVPPLPKVTPLIAKLIYRDKTLNSIPAIQWGQEQEQNALKLFYSVEACKHQDFKLQSCGLYVDRTHPYIGASPDGIMYCKCHQKSVIEIKCPYNIKDETIQAGVAKCNFLTVIDNKITLKKSHKYYTQIISQIMLSDSLQGFFVVWTKKDIFIETIVIDKVHWNKVYTNLQIFFQQYVAKALLAIKPVKFCADCEKVLLTKDEIAEDEANEKSICCDQCSSWYHYKCQSIIHIDKEINWLCCNCLTDIPQNI